MVSTTIYTETVHYVQVILSVDTMKNSQHQDTDQGTSGDLYVTAATAAELLGVSVTTLYAYVGRKGIRSQALPGSRSRRYWRADIERVLQEGGKKPVLDAAAPLSDITLVTAHGGFYRGHNIIELSAGATLEQVATLLWQVDTAELPRQVLARPAQFQGLFPFVQDMISADRASVLFPFLERADPRAYDLTQAGVARTGTDILRWYAALLTGAPEATTGPVHEVIGAALGLTPAWQDLVRRLLVLGADTGIDGITGAVRAAASIGVTPWRTVLTGLSLITGRWSKLGRAESLYRLLDEIAQYDDPRQAILQRVREGEPVPGFSPVHYPDGDYRAGVLLAQMRHVLGDDADLARLDAAIGTAREVCQMGPNFALLNYYIGRRIGLPRNDSLFPLYRLVGWVAHTMEQYAIGEAQFGTARRNLLQYAGPLPA